MIIDDEFKKKHNFLGQYSAQPSLIDKRDYIASFVPMEEITLPDEYITPNLIPIYNQGEVGSCVAHASDTMFEYLNQLHNGKYEAFSKGFIYAHKDDLTSSGMMPRTAVKFLCNEGNVLYNDFPYNLEVPDITTQYNKSGGDGKLLSLANQHKEITSYAQLQVTDKYSIKMAIYKYGYIIAEIPIREDTELDFELINEDAKTHICSDYNAIFNEGTGSIKGYHMIALCGWSKKYNSYYFANSWNNDWGKNGFAFLPYSYNLIEVWSGMGNNTIIHNTPSPTPIIYKKSNNSFLQFIWKIINWIINYFHKN